MAQYQPITFIIPCRNNLKYLKQAVSSIEDNYNDYHHIVILDDASNDGTWEWSSSLWRKQAKESALIAVDEMILVLPFTDTNAALNEYAIHLQKYLEQVKHEIEKL